MNKIVVCKILFWAFVCLYAFGVAYAPAFGVIDDHTLLKTLFVGEDIGFFIIPEIGRFFPLDGQELNILSALFGLNANVFYIFNALCVLVVVLALRYALRVILDSALGAANAATNTIDDKAQAGQFVSAPPPH